MFLRSLSLSLSLNLTLRSVCWAFLCLMHTLQVWLLCFWKTVSCDNGMRGILDCKADQMLLSLLEILSLCVCNASHPFADQVFSDVFTILVEYGMLPIF